MDHYLQLAIASLGLTTNFLVVWRTRSILNPLTIISVTFFLPLYFAMSRLSRLQATSWRFETYAVVALAIVFLMLLPFFYLMANAQWGKRAATARDASDANVFKSEAFLWVARGFALLVIALFLLANKVQGGMLLLLLKPDVASGLHTTFPFAIRFFARASPLAVALLFVAFYYHRRKIDLILMVGAFAVPLTRLSRIDPYISCVILVILNAYLPVIQFRARSFVYAGIMLLVVGIGMVELGLSRGNQFGRYNLKYEEMIGWRPHTLGPRSVLPVLYGYFPLSFENFDRYVRANETSRMYGLLSFDWLFSGLFKANWMGGYGELFRESTFKPVSGAANVPTVLYAFYGDFGAAGAWMPMLLYMLVWLELYRRAGRTVRSTILYSVYSAGWALSSFQAIIVAAILVYQLFEAVLLIWLTRRLMAFTTRRPILAGIA